MNFDWLKPRKTTQAKEGYLKNSSPLVYGLFILAALLYYPTHGYGSVVALILVAVVMAGQQLMLNQVKQDFALMTSAKARFLATGEPDQLDLIEAHASRLLRENKLLTTRAREELAELLTFTQKQRAATNAELSDTLPSL